jgi:hypothetical protein
MASELNRIVTELIIDARGSVAGAAQHVRASKEAELASNKLSDAEEKGRIAREKSAASFMGVSSSIARVRSEYTNLQARLDPVFSAQIRQQKELERAILVTDAAVRRGVTTEQQATATISRLRDQQIRDMQRVKAAAQDLIRVQRAANDNSSKFATANIAAQFQDIGVTAAMGMSPLQIALQQGTQLQAVLGPMGAAGAVRALGSAFLSLLNPVSLATMALVAAVAAAIQYFTATDEAEESNQKIREHAQIIDGVVRAWGDALPALKSYNTELERRIALDELSRATEAYVEKQYAPVRQEMPDVRSQIAAGAGKLYIEDMDAAIRLRDAFQALTDAVADNKATVEQVDAVINALSVSMLAASEPVQAAIDKLRDFRETIADANEKADPARIQKYFAELGSAMQKWWGQYSGPFIVAWEKFKGFVKEFDDLNKREGAAVPIPTRRPNDIQRMDEEAAAAERAEKAQGKLTAAYDRTIESARERNEQLQVSLKYLGDYSVEAQAAVYAQQLMNQALSDGKSLTPEQTAEINRLAQAYAELSQAIGIARAEQDLQFERDQLSRTPVEQRVYAELRNLGLDINSIEGQRIADNIRINEELERQISYAEDVRDTLKEGASSFLQDLFTGKDLMESIVRLGDRFASMNFDAFVEGASNWMSGKGFTLSSSSARANIPAARATGQEIAKPVVSAIKDIAEGPAWERQGRGGIPGMPAAIQTGKAMAQGVVPAIQEPLNRQVDVIAGAIRKIESGNNYGAVGMQTKYGKPLGAYQILESNLPQWSQQALGRVVSASEFLGDRLTQDQVAYYQLTKLLQKYNGRFEDVASVWNSGRPLSQSGSIVDPYNGQSVNTYVNKVMGAVKAGSREGTQVGAESGVKEGTFDAWAGLREVTTGKQGASGGFNMQGLVGLLGAGLGGFSTGYQSGNAGMGLLGGAVQGLGAGMQMTAVLGTIAPVIGAVVGGIAGLIGGLMGARAKLKAAKRELEKQMNAINNLLAVGEGRGIGVLQKQLSDYLGEIDKAVSLAWKAKNFDLVDRLHESWNAMFLRLRRDHRDALPGQIEAYSSGYGTDSPLYQGSKAMRDLREELRTFMADVRYFGEETLRLTDHVDPANAENIRQLQIILEQSVADATESAKRMILAFIGGRQEFTEYESAVQAVQGAVAAAQTALEELGMSAFAAAEALGKQLNAAIKKLQSAYIDDRSSRFYELNDGGYFNDLLDAQKRYQDGLRDEAALGITAGYASRELALSLRNIVKEAKLTDDQIRQLAAAMPELSASLMGLIGMGEGGDTAQALADAQAKVEDAKAALRSAYEKERSEIESTISRLKSFTEGIRNFRDSLRLDKELSPLDAAERLAEAQRQFESISAKALAGDENAMGRLEEVSRAYLEEARSYYGSNEMYYAIWQQVDATLDQALAKAGSQLSAVEKQLASLEKQVGKLIDIDDGVKSVEDAIAELKAAEAAEAAAQAADDAYKNTVFQEMLAVLKAQLAAQSAAAAAQQTAATASTANYSASDPVANIYRKYLGREPDPVGYAFYSGNLNAGLTTLAGIEADIKKHAQDAGIYKGYAAGGYTGDFGRMSVAGVVHGQEFVMNAMATDRWRPQFEAMNRGVWPAANDNQASLLQRLIEQVRMLEDSNARLQERLAQIVAAGFQQSVQSTDRAAGAMEQGNRMRSFEARRKAA